MLEGQNRQNLTQQLPRESVRPTEGADGLMRSKADGILETGRRSTTTTEVQTVSGIVRRMEGGGSFQ